MPSPNRDQEAAAREAMTAMPAMLREIREVMYLPDDDPRRQGRYCGEDAGSRPDRKVEACLDRIG